MAAGLTVISNHYNWINEFSKNMGFEPIWLKDIKDIKDIRNKFNCFSWESILDNCRFDDFVISIIEAKA